MMVKETKQMNRCINTIKSTLSSSGYIVRPQMQCLDKKGFPVRLVKDIYNIGSKNTTLTVLRKNFTTRTII